MKFQWTDYSAEDAPTVDRWLDVDAVAMTGLDMLWDDYWNALLADAVNFPGCKDYCKMVRVDGMAVAAVCFGHYEGVATVSEIVVAPQFRGRGYGTRILQDLIAHSGELLGEKVDKISAVIFPANVASQRAFEKAGFVCDYAYEDETALHYVCQMPASERVEGAL